MKQISAVKSFFAWLAVVLALAAGIPTAARAQNHTCPTPAIGDNSNKCASTAFVQGAITGNTVSLFRANNLSDLANAATARSNLGVAIGSNVEAWSADLDCLASISATGTIKRTGSGTCAAGAVALSDLATGTQDTLIGYFGAITGSAASLPNCSNSLTYSTSTHTFGCNGSNVAGSGNSVSGNIPQLSNASTTAIVDSGNPASALPTTIGQLPAVTPSTTTVTITIASPAVVTWTSHGLAPNSPVVFTTTGALPTGITAGTEYYVIGSSITTNTFQVATSVANAKAGIAVNTSGSQSGTQTGTANASADSGNVGNLVEFDLGPGSAITMTSGVTSTIISGNLSAGRWLTWGNVVFSAQGSTAYTEVHASMSLINNGIQTLQSNAFHVTFGTGQTAIIPTPNYPLSFTTTTTIYLTASTTVTGGSAMLAYGHIWALRLP